MEGSERFIKDQNQANIFNLESFSFYLCTGNFQNLVFKIIYIVKAYII
jgi:hypothetical protein